MQDRNRENRKKGSNLWGRVSKFDSREHHKDDAYRQIIAYTFAMSCFFLLASIIGMIYTNERDFWYNVYKIITSPSKLITDYFALGGLGSTFFNAAVCGFCANAIILLTGKKVNATTFAGYMLVVAHCFYGLNFVNMWPPLIGVLVYCIITRRPFTENTHTALFSTALGPFVSELLFRYTLKGGYVFGEVKISLLSVILALVFGVLVGFLIPAINSGTTSMHRGYNMYKAGLALGLMGIFVYNFLYTSLGIPHPVSIIIDNPEYFSLPYAYRGFMNVFFISLFSLTIVWGFASNNLSFRGYRELFRSTGYGTDFLDKFGMPVCMINIGLCGLFIIGYLNIIFVLPSIFPSLPSGVGFTGATVGVVFAALTFTADGQQPRTVWPIVLGYTLLFLFVCLISKICGFDIPWTLSTQSYINGLAFSTGLCPFSGKYGWWAGTVAGILSAVICTATSQMHGGLVLYNGGFTAGLTALVLLPVLDFYNVKAKYEDDRE